MPSRAAVLLSAVLLGACATATVAVKNGFDFAKVKRVAVVSVSDYGGRPGSGETVAGAFEQATLAAGYDVVERAQADKVLAERRLSATDPRVVKELGKSLGVDAVLFGRITDYKEPRERLVQEDVVDTHDDPIYVRRTRQVQQPDGSMRTVETSEVTGYRTTRVVRREPRTLTQYGRLGVTARLVYVPTGEVLWTGSDASSVFSFEESARAVADSILKAVRKTWPKKP